ncbi:O-antigen ligase family protein, partial [Gottfriedia acidiceleris]|uniref:O-antigen ligase family protein n=1 Tax=Gottfriedia acidiceleris TaxID=371036 RepID=UPI0030002B35
YYPQKTKLRLINLSLASVELICTQSKTSWFIVGVFIIFSIIKHVLQLIKKRDKYLFYSICIFIGIFLLIVLFQIVNNISVFISPVKLEQLKTVTGRTYIWKYTLDIWKNSPIFGHGINVWSDPLLIDSFLKYYGWAPGTAHNLFIHTLGRAGLVGLVSLILYLITLIVIIFRMKNNNDKYFLFLLWNIIIFKSITEVPLTDSISDSGFIIEFIILGILIISKNKNIK